MSVLLLILQFISNYFKMFQSVTAVSIKLFYFSIDYFVIFPLIYHFWDFRRFSAVKIYGRLCIHLKSFYFPKSSFYFSWKWINLFISFFKNYSKLNYDVSLIFIIYNLIITWLLLIFKWLITIIFKEVYYE